MIDAERDELRRLIREYSAAEIEAAVIRSPAKIAAASVKLQRLLDYVDNLS